jgi:hypothetical protein
VLAAPASIRGPGRTSRTPSVRPSRAPPRLACRASVPRAGPPPRPSRPAGAEVRPGPVLGAAHRLATRPALGSGSPPPFPDSWLVRLGTRTPRPAFRRRGTTRRPSVPVPPVTRIGDVMSPPNHTKSRTRCHVGWVSFVITTMT